MSNLDEIRDLTESVNNLKTAVESGFVAVRKDHESAIKTLTELSRDVWGTGDDNIGIKMKVKTLTDKEEDRKFWRKVLGGAVVTLIGERFFSYFTKGH